MCNMNRCARAHMATIRRRNLFGHCLRICEARDAPGHTRAQ
jgi:hypothetical protein